MTNSSTQAGFLVLAAGKSRRFNGDKLLAPSPTDNTKSILAATIDSLPKSYAIHVVCRPSHQAVVHELISLQQHHPQISFSKQGSSELDLAENGIGDSIRLGIKATCDWKGWVICLADMPWIQTSTYESIIRALDHHDIVLPYYKPATPSDSQRPGNPVGFSQKHYDSLIKLSGDTGGRAIVRHNAKDIYKLTVEDPGILLDIDYPDDINQSP